MGFATTGYASTVRRSIPSNIDRTWALSSQLVRRTAEKLLFRIRSRRRDRHYLARIHIAANQQATGIDNRPDLSDDSGFWLRVKAEDATQIVGGMITSTIHTLILVPVF
jgi:hypothetical protein